MIVEPFAGLGTVIYRAIALGRIGYGVELAQDYFDAARRYCQQIEREVTAPTLFDLLSAIEQHQTMPNENAIEVTA